MNANGRSQRAAFSLLEVAVVIVIVGILAISVVPALGSMGGAREAGAARETHRLLAHVRAFAMTTGQPAGVVVDAAAGTLTPVYIPSGQPSPAPLPSNAGTETGPMRLAESFPGAQVLWCTGGDGSTGVAGLWFSHNGTPQVRDADGALLGAFSQDATIAISGGYTVSVRRVSGLVER